MSRTLSAPFRGRHFDDVIIILCVRWYLRHSLSCRDLKEMMAERGVAVDHDHLASGPALRAPFESAASPRAQAAPMLPGGWMRRIEVAGDWTYLYHAVDSAGDTIDFMLSPKRDLTAARLFLRLALSGTSGIRPQVINVDEHPAYARAIAEWRQSGGIWIGAAAAGPHLI